MEKQRLDILLVEKNLCASRHQAQRCIGAGEVKVNGEIVDKSGTKIPVDADVTLRAKPPYVSRGGEKLHQAMVSFEIDVGDRICLDGGISTGGFTDCLLQAGAKKVYGIDVGYGQVAWKIRQDSRVHLQERTNFRYLTPEKLYNSETPANLGVMDLSFISLTKVLPTLKKLLVSPQEVILLVKPQFEVGRERVGKKGVVRNIKDRADAIMQVWKTASTLGWNYQGLTTSPIKGPAGNIEYLLWLDTNPSDIYPDLVLIEEIIGNP